MRFLRSQDAGIPSTKRETGLKRMKFWEKSGISLAKFSMYAVRHRQV